MSRAGAGRAAGGRSGAATPLALFADPISQRLWTSYLVEVEKTLQVLPTAQRRELLHELQSHLLDGMRADGAAREPERLLNAMERLGAPNEYLRPLVAERLLARASSTMHPAAVLTGMYHDAFRSVGRALATVGFSLGYTVVALLVAGAVLKPITPRTIGVFREPDGSLELNLLLGEFAPSVTLGTDVLGYWVVPAFLATALVLYVALTKLLPILGVRSDVEVRPR